MPRPPKQHHPLREIRAAAGQMSQTAFAELVGVSMATIQALEGGKLKMTPKLAARIAEATGAAESELIKGVAGKAKTVDGQKYTAKSFEAWESLKQKRGKHINGGGGSENVIRWMQWLLDSARQQGEASLGTARTALIESMESIRTKLNLEDFLNDYLIPFQAVETHTAEMNQWRKSDSSRVLSLGFGSSIPLGPKGRLTISLQTLPSWSPGTTPPAPVPTNMDLIPAGYFVLGLGTAGCRMAEAWWQALCSEHGIDFTTGQAIYGVPTGNWQCFFRRVSQMHGSEKYVPRAVFADLDNESLSQISIRAGDLFHTASFLTGEQSSGNVFAGADHPVARGIIENVWKILERYSQDVGGVSGVFLLHSLEGGSGGGLAHQLLWRLKKELPSCPIVTVSPVPDPALGHSVTAPYNLALTLQAVSSCAQIGLYFDPAVLVDEALKIWKVPVRDVESFPNLLIANVLSVFTAPMRFPGEDSAPILLPDWLAQISGRVDPEFAAFYLPEVKPLQVKTNLKKPILTAEELVKACSSMLAGAGGKKLPQAAIFLRARNAEDLWGTRRVMGHSVARKFRISARRDPRNFENVTTFTGAGELGVRLGVFASQATNLMRRKAYLHWYSAIGIGEAEVLAAVTHLEDLSRRLASITLD